MIRLSEYSDDLLYRVFVWFAKNERHTGTSDGARMQRRALLQMVIAACRYRPELPDPKAFFEQKRLARGVYLADDMRAFVMLVYDTMESLRDPQRQQTQAEYDAELKEWRRSFDNRYNINNKNPGGSQITYTARKAIAKSQTGRPRRARNVIRA